MKMKEIRNGSLYKKGNGIVRARQTLNTSSVTVSKPHSEDLEAAKVSDLKIASNDEVEDYLKVAESKERMKSLAPGGMAAPREF
jgi:hypothetical protein